MLRCVVPKLAFLLDPARVSRTDLTLHNTMIGSLYHATFLVAIVFAYLPFSFHLALLHVIQGRTITEVAISGISDEFQDFGDIAWYEADQWRGLSSLPLRLTAYTSAV